MGFLKTGTQWQEDDTAWVGFGLAAQKAAVAVSFHRHIPAQFAAALGQLVSNIHEHSGTPNSGVAAFKASGQGFEFAALDRGIGILESLRTCPNYAELAGQGQALQLALSDGIPVLDRTQSGQRFSSDICWPRKS